MVKFAHIADVHLGGWKQKPMQDLNVAYFHEAINLCLTSKVDFILFAGDLFDSAFPPIEILKDTFAEFRRLKEAKIPCFIIAGSHDYSASGKTFLEVLEKAGFCENVTKIEEKEGALILSPIIYEGVAIYGYPGKKAGLEIPDLRKIKLNDSPGLFRILMLHTTLEQAKGTLPIDSIEAELLPQVDYYAFGHLHIDFVYKNFVYPGPIFPESFKELEDLKGGGFYIVDTNSSIQLQKIDLKLKEILSLTIEIKDSLKGKEEILNKLSSLNVRDKIVLLRIKGELETGKISDLGFPKIEDFLRKEGAYFFLKNTHELKSKEVELEYSLSDSKDVEKDSIRKFSTKNSNNFNKLIPLLMNVLSIEKQEGEKGEVFLNRIFEDSKKVLKF